MKRMMKNILVGVLISLPLVSYGYDDGDFQIWLKGAVSGKFDNGVTIKMEEELKYGDSASEFWDEETALVLGYKVNDWLKSAVGYKVVQERKNKTVVTPKTTSGGSVSYASVGDGDHYWQNEERPFADLIFSHKISGWGLSDRTRFECRMKDDGGDDYLRFRNRIKVKTPWKFSSLKMNPYAAWEVFFEDKDSLSGSDKWDRHRIYVGVSTKLSELISGGLYYLAQLDHSNDWKQTNVAGLEVSVKF